MIRISYLQVVPISVLSFVLMHHLYLRSVSCGDVGDGPACLFANGLFCTAEKVQQTGQGWAVQHHLHRRSKHYKQVMKMHCFCLQRMWAMSLLTILPPVFGYHLQWQCFLQLSRQGRPPYSQCACRKRGLFKNFKYLQALFLVTEMPESTAGLTWVVLQDACRRQSRWQPGSYHWGHLRGRKVPSRHLPASLGHC